MAERDDARTPVAGGRGERPEGAAGLGRAGQHRDPDGDREGAGRVLVRGPQHRPGAVPGSAPASGRVAAAHEAAGAMPTRVADSRTGLPLSSAVAGTW